MLSRENSRSVSPSPEKSDPTLADPIVIEPVRSLWKQAFDVAKETAERSSIHGFPSFSSSKVHWIIKLIWLVAVGASWGYLIYQINNSISLYNSYSVVSSTSIVYEAPTDFFAVDICSLSPINPSWNYSMFNRILSITSLNGSYSYISFIDSADTFIQVLLEYYSSRLEYNIYDSGIALSDMLISCEFQGMPCSVEDFYWYHDFNYGNCYRFNGGAQAKTQTYGSGLTYTSRPVEKTYQPGWRLGLRMELFSPTALTSTPYFYKNGFKITVHNQSRDVYPDEDGFDVPVGFETNVAVSKTFISRLPKPYSNCIDKLTEKRSGDNGILKIIKGQIDSGQILAYQQASCLKICLQFFVYERCNCSYPNYIFLNVLPLNSICFTDEQNACMNEAFKYYRTANIMNECLSYCPVECKTSKYETKITTANYPTQWYADYINRNQAVFNLSFIYNTTNITYDLIRSSTAFVSIYYDSMEYTLIQESPTFTFDLLLANIGGNLGLFTGMSFLSFVEFVEALVSVIIVAVIFKNKKTKNPD